MATLIVHNDLPRLLGFQRRAVRLVPGANEVDKAIFDSCWKQDKTMRWYWGEGAFYAVGADGKEYIPDGAPDRTARGPSQALTGPQRTASGSLRPPPPGVSEGAEKPPQGTTTAPRPQGTGGVPGVVEEAKGTIKETSDLDVLEHWLINDPRSSVKKAIADRIKELKEPEDDGEDEGEG